MLSNLAISQRRYIQLPHTICTNCKNFPKSCQFQNQFQSRQSIHIGRHLSTCIHSPHSENLQSVFRLLLLTTYYFTSGILTERETYTHTRISESTNPKCKKNDSSCLKTNRIKIEFLTGSQRAFSSNCILRELGGGDEENVEDDMKQLLARCIMRSSQECFFREFFREIDFARPTSQQISLKLQRNVNTTIISKHSGLNTILDQENSADNHKSLLEN